MTLQADGLRKGRRLVAAKEEDIYDALGLPFNEASTAASSSIGKRKPSGFCEPSPIVIRRSSDT
jgi:hypothetical protein